MKRYSIDAEERYCDDERGMFMLYTDHLAAVEQAQAWKRAVDDLLATWYTTADSYATPREAVKGLIAFEVMTALDPKVSSDAAALVEQARMEEREACARLCDSLRSVIVDDALVPAAPGHCAAALRARKT